MDTNQKIENERILRLTEVEEKIGLSRSSIYERIKTGDFPAPINLGGRCIGFLESEIDAWINVRAQTRHVTNKRS